MPPLYHYCNRYLQEHGMHFSACASGLMGDDKLRFLSLLFYFSKYYEFLDTWLVRAKGRAPIFLQVHAAANYTVDVTGAVCMWFGGRDQGIVW